MIGHNELEEYLGTSSNRKRIIGHTCLYMDYIRESLHNEKLSCEQKLKEIESLLKDDYEFNKTIYEFADMHLLKNYY